MVRPKKKEEEMEMEVEDDGDDERSVSIERQRLKHLAFSTNMLSRTATSSSSALALAPSKTLLKHHGKDILRKSHRKNRYLFSFPALLAPVAGAGAGKIGELKDLSTGNPILYLQFPQGQMKLFGTVVYPKNRYLTLQFSRGGKNVLCEDYFDNIIVFSDAWWIGKKEDNPEEARLHFPTQLTQGQCTQYDFKGGAGATPAPNDQLVPKANETKYAEDESPEEFENDSPGSDDTNSFKDSKEATPSRQSARMAGRTFKFAEVSSGDGSTESNTDTSKEEEKIVKTDISSAVVLDIDNECAAEVTTSKENSHGNRGSLVQSTISTLFKKVHEKQKVEDKVAQRNSRKSRQSKASGRKFRQTDLKEKISQAERLQKRVEVIEGKKAGKGARAKKKVYEVEDDIEEFSSSSQDAEGSDEDWGA